ncbi:putative protein N(5)-glutamine methyltransferase [Tersicoccus sp. Bi-70]|uniref:putative protein N(5)-glutamine methyltransferase n=1 Tax=Tersicoccus sp. Bi-70 TaxID=1897634 RepID=UPI0009780CD1|nr:putative protein N(5)-glutamine methyltransferase [Tersicoccus sp. Bi-70]OMH36621.1 hypothetical protein BGP79_12425 [Tersicoccus sp. Bi-70]
MNGAAVEAQREDVIGRLRRSGCVFAEEEAELLFAAEQDDAAREDLIRRRVAGEPLEHVLGWAAFGDLRVVVHPGVFVPRRRTLLLARLAAAALHRVEGARVDPGHPPTALELCCGVAAVTARLARLTHRPDRGAPRRDADPAPPAASAVSPVRLIAADIDPDAVACARLNAPGALVLEGDLFAALPRGVAGTIDVVVANAPYVPTAAIGSMPPEARDHEHRVALDGGADGLDVQRRIAADVGRWLAPGGTVIVETSVRQAPASAGLFRDAGLRTRVVRDDRVEGTAVVARAPRRALDSAGREAGERHTGAAAHDA